MTCDEAMEQAALFAEERAEVFKRFKPDELIYCRTLVTELEQLGKLIRSLRHGPLGYAPKPR
jgi:hypothetical protein